MDKPAHCCLSSEPDAPTDLRFTDITDNSVLVIWSVPRSQITGYRLLISAGSSSPKQLRIPGDESQYTISSLHPDTEYMVTLYSEQGNTLSEGVTDVFRTRTLTFVSSFEAHECVYYRSTKSKFTQNVQMYS